MCNHYANRTPRDVEAFARRFAEKVEAEFQPAAPHAWPKAPMPIIWQDDVRTLATRRWGVWPFWEPKLPSRPVVNARDDGLTTKSIWKQSTAKRRCLVPADGFFEWTGPKGAKWEVLFHLPKWQPFFFAGIWSPDPKDGGRGFALVTGKPNEAVAALPHDRMPVILEGPNALEWMGREPLSNERLEALCAPFAGTLIREDQK